MVSEPEEWPAFESYLHDIKLLKNVLLAQRSFMYPGRKIKRRVV
ncbi:unnamed protein product [Brassica rapa]|uniref:Uncharacterized protein n=1 Tax=Brassica campestris TaxID=3711 RepID=A0A3P5Y745_BRACM|nr:unnamed protein product [Brassica rapa]VDC59594.1 unnamed protein product [Brassica rapa]